MAVLMTTGIPVSRVDIEAFSADTGAAENPPEGLILHLATETHRRRPHRRRLGEQGALRQVQRRAAPPGVGRRMAAMGMAMEGAPPQATITEVFDVLRGR